MHWNTFALLISHFVLLLIPLVLPYNGWNIGQLVSPEIPFTPLLTNLWNHWNRRIDFIHNKCYQPSGLTVLNSKVLLRDYAHYSSSSNLGSSSLPTMQRLRWQPPREGYIKINTDEAYNQTTQDAEIQVIAFDNKGMMLGGLAQNSTHSLDALHTGFFVVLAGIQLAHDKDWHFVHIESDSAIIINKFTRDGPNLSVIGAHVVQSRLMLRDFDDFLITFTPRACNSAAHSLASHACHTGCSFFFESVCLELIKIVVLADMPI
ncbi:hypothetical protein GQ457_08G025290 [Hibiscus cannabinus]